MRESVRGWSSTKLRAARREAGLTQEELGSLIGTTQSAVQTWERLTGGGAPSARYFSRLVDVLRLDPTDLLTIARADAFLRDLRVWAGHSQTEVQTRVRLRQLGPIERGAKPLPPVCDHDLAELYGASVSEVRAAADRTRAAWRAHIEARRRV